MQTNHTVPVLIVGAGPVGLATALFLAQHGIQACIVERHPSTAIHPRARGVNPRTMELFRSLGIDKAVREAGSVLLRNEYMLVVETLAGKELQRILRRPGFAQESEQLSPETFCMCAQDELEPLLVSTAQQRGVDIRFNSQLTAFEQDDCGVTAHILERTSGRQYDIHASYLVAADGARSPVRKVLGATMAGRGSMANSINIYFRADIGELTRGREFIICLVQGPEVQGTFVSVNNTDRWEFNISFPAGQEPDVADFPRERCVELVRKAVGIPDLAVEVLSILSWEAAVRVTDHFQYRRVFFAGDSAHLMPPAGAFGMNTGIQDAHNLAWKLAMVLRGEAGSELLASYDTERHAIAQMTTEQAGLRYGDVNIMIRPPSEYPENGKVIHDLAIMLGYRYTSPAIIDPPPDAAPVSLSNLNGTPGTRAPHVWLEREGQRLSTLDLFGTRFVLLVGEDGASWCRAAGKAAVERGVSLDMLRVGSEGDLIDISQAWNQRYGISPRGAVLVRPDGFIAWRGVEGNEAREAEFGHILDRVLGKCNS